MKYLIAAVIGAVIGYLTNYIAIKMIFRPYNEKRIFGVRIPFTPGLIPKERFRIAKSVGKTVGEHLITEDDIVESLCNKEIEESLEKWVNDELEIVIKERKTINDYVDKLNLDLDLRGLLSTQIEKIIIEYLNSEETDKGLKNLIYEEVNKSLSGNKTIDSLIPDNIKLSIKSMIFNKRDIIAEELKKVLGSESTEVKIKKAIDEAISTRLSPMVSMFINSNVIYDYLLPEVNNFLDNDENKKEIAQMINGSLMDRVFETTMDELSVDTIDTLSNFISDKILTVMKDENMANKLKPVVDSIIENIISRPIADIIGDDVEKLKKVSSHLIRNIYNNLVRCKAKAFISKFNISEMVENKINEFDIEFTEKLVLDLANKELSAITWLGGLLGGLIGILSPIIGSIL
ncbi:Uncharacterized membrane protein YheB, UPF0754 family [Clostridium collagenovorans DSM 3089]|uniref:Uncharacterized membrane protein YheB, UPF0754 family n=1 Tax=Clostridium collagenovorans DSM 3089 TaxID=1121306 RepID=A0A1M5W7G2_9CLOT|nr:DUF445 family protein [Clostridium collagenovorans]SHH83124.1 Uncharacterized membrane protein YheB, UPF0754 family [Clostridium collagenovorans DSM 3089]